LFTDVITLNNIFNKINVFINRTVDKIIPVQIKEIKIIKNNINNINKKDLIKIKAVKN